MNVRPSLILPCLSAALICESEDLFISATHAEALKGIDPTTLSKVWKIDIETASNTLKVTSQYRKVDVDNSLSRNFSTNECMIRYKRIYTHFFTDTFFVTKKANSTKSNTCIQIFVRDKGFVFVVPMRSKSEFKDALKICCKEVGVPDE